MPRWDSGGEARFPEVLTEFLMRRLRFHVAYDGTDFHGWQVQPGLLTIQGILEEIISGIEGRPVHVAGSGRTDAGVHAYSQVAAVSIENPIPAPNFRKAVNRMLPFTIRITHAEEVREDFHPRFQATRKTYEYRILRDEICSPFERRFVHHHPFPLDEAAMMAGASLLEGEHDFTAFAGADAKESFKSSKIRTIFHSSFTRTDSKLIYRVIGSGFLKHMVRNIVGVMLEVGKRNLTAADVRRRLGVGCGIPPGPSVPPSGLFLMSVEYEEPATSGRSLP
jgi:tRNA pseudouridine38-40 synthase